VFGELKKSGLLENDGVLLFMLFNSAFRKVGVRGNSDIDGNIGSTFCDLDICICGSGELEFCKEQLRVIFRLTH
jgi:hypothetical protein